MYYYIMYHESLTYMIIFLYDVDYVNKYVIGLNCYKW